MLQHEEVVTSLCHLNVPLVLPCPAETLLLASICPRAAAQSHPYKQVFILVDCGYKQQCSAPSVHQHQNEVSSVVASRHNAEQTTLAEAMHPNVDPVEVPLQHL